MTSIKHRWIHSVLIVAIGAGCLWNAGRQHSPILEQRKELNKAEPMENLPPLVAFITVALGGFRGIMADILWVRAQRLQSQGKYIEIVQLADWICKLQPRMDAIWAYQAWNMSYNISVMYPGPDDRWRWVNHGTHLLRDQGLHYNPGSAMLHKELAWIYHHKMGADMDMAHWYYKQEWALEMTQLLGGVRPDYDRLKALNISDEAFEKRPETGALVQRLRADKINPYSPAFLSGQGIAPDIMKLVTSDPAGRDLIDFIRVRQLRDYYNLDIDYMRELEEIYGSLDWRLAQTHAVYWANRGMPYAEGFEQIQLQRMIFQPIATALVKSRVVIDPLTRSPITTSNLEFLEPGLRAFENAISAHPEEGTFHTAYINFLKRAAIELYSYQNAARAGEMMDLLRVTYPERYGEEDNEKMLFDFLVRAKNPIPEHVVDQAMGEFLQTAKFWDRAGDPDRAAGYRELAQLVRRQAAANDIILPDDEAIIARLKAYYARAVQKQKEAAALRKKSPPDHNTGHDQGHGHRH